MNLAIKEIIIKPLMGRLLQFLPQLNALNSYRYQFGRMPNLINPITFNERIIKKMIFDRDPKLPLFADKYRVRDYVSKKLGGTSYLTKLFAVITKPQNIKGLRLPNRFVMKANHLSGQVFFVRKDSDYDINDLIEKASEWMNRNYYFSYYEWAYKKIKPCIFFEELLNPDGGLPDDFKFLCFNGEPKIIQVDRNRFSKHRRNFYDIELNLLPFNKKPLKNFAERIEVINYHNMLDIAKKLSENTDFLRVDLYNIKGKIYFSELTNYPSAGLAVYDPPEWDRIIGKLWEKNSKGIYDTAKRNYKN